MHCHVWPFQHSGPLWSPVWDSPVLCCVGTEDETHFLPWKAVRSAAKWNHLEPTLFPARVLFLGLIFPSVAGCSWGEPAQGPIPYSPCLEPDSEQASVSPSVKATLVLSEEFELPAWTQRV